jgi:hypothetical protein
VGNAGGRGRTHGGVVVSRRRNRDGNNGDLVGLDEVVAAWV